MIFHELIFLSFLLIQTCIDDGSQQMMQKKGTMQYAAINPTSAKYTQGISSTQNSTAGGSTMQQPSATDASIASSTQSSMQQNANRQVPQ